MKRTVALLLAIALLDCHRHAAKIKPPRPSRLLDAVLRVAPKGEQCGRDRGQMERELFRYEETIQLERVERRHDEHDRDRTELHDSKGETLGATRSFGLFYLQRVHSRARV